MPFPAKNLPDQWGYMNKPGESTIGPNSPNGGVRRVGGLSRWRRLVTNADAVITTEDDAVDMSTGNTDRVALLPDATACPDFEFEITKTDAGTGHINVTSVSAQTFVGTVADTPFSQNGTTTPYVITGRYKAARFFSDGVSWRVTVLN